MKCQTCWFEKTHGVVGRRLSSGWDCLKGKPINTRGFPGNGYVDYCVDALCHVNHGEAPRVLTMRLTESVTG